MGTLDRPLPAPLLAQYLPSFSPPWELAARRRGKTSDLVTVWPVLGCPEHEIWLSWLPTAASLGVRLANLTPGSPSSTALAKSCCAALEVNFELLTSGENLLDLG
jgi:hypothetical protein